ncbi:MAG TPA: hypothetical protein VFF73_23400 [Planctomycetota bacterium]|nr:hypothetical protein [Planctomycetota bacterium]
MEPSKVVEMCPHCRQAVALDRATWSVCAGCLARHHSSCWMESRCCALCGDARALVEASGAPRRRRGVVLLVGSLVVLAGQGAAALYLSMRLENALRRGLDENAAVVKRLSRSEAPPDRTDEVLEKLDSFEKASDARRHFERLEAKVAAVQGAPVVVAGEPRPSRAAAIVALADARNEGLLASSEFDAAKRALLEGRLTADVAMELDRLSKLRKDGSLRSSELSRIKTELLSER